MIRLTNKRYTLNAILGAAIYCYATYGFAAIQTNYQHNERNSTPISFFIAPKQSSASSAGEAAQIAKSIYGGKVLKVSAQKTEAGLVYRVKLLLDNGHVKTVVIAGQ